MKLARRRALLLTAGLALLAAAGVGALLLSQGEKDLAAGNDREPAERTSSSLHDRFAVLSRQRTNQCGLGPESLDAITVGNRLQGSCCSPMVYERYVEQVRGLRRHASVPEIPADPYDIPVALAKRLITYADTITLTPAQQAVYREAVELSQENGPCGCHCWRWTAFEGQAKLLITRRSYTADQVAEVWGPRGRLPVARATA